MSPVPTICPLSFNMVAAKVQGLNAQPQLMNWVCFREKCEWWMVGRKACAVRALAESMGPTFMPNGRES